MTAVTRLINFSGSIAFKFYLVIIVASFIVVVLGINLYMDAKGQIRELSNENQIATTRNIVNTFTLWIDERTRALQMLSKIIQNSNAISDEARLKRIIKTFYENSNDYNAVQFLKTNGEIYLNGEIFGEDDEQKQARLGLIWYHETMVLNEPSINFMPRHTTLNEPTINICVPNHDAHGFAGTLCGIVKLTEIFKNLRNFDLPPDFYTFVVTHSGDVITPMDDTELKQQVQSHFKEALLTQGDEPRELNIGSNFISIGQIYSLNWFVGAGVDSHKRSRDLLRLFQSSAIALFLSFILLILVANSLHGLMYRIIKRKNDEYEILLAHKTKMSEAGELISGINHQFIQPVNSLNLMISTLLMLEREGNLDRQSLREILKNGENSVHLLRDTIEIFRNFYKASDDAVDFSLRQSIKNLLTLMHTELSRANVSVVLHDFADVNLHQRENIIQQILLILLHNAKDAVVGYFEDFTKRVIYIHVSVRDQICYVRVSDHGSGVSDAVVGRIFSEPKTTKSSGNGIGLYFGRKLARQKLNGELALISAKDPTEFELSFALRL